ncbi:MAG: cytoskeleton protein RodZ [Rhodoferax sp.]|jgi:cytoskeleton protein RodZ
MRLLPTKEVTLMNEKILNSAENLAPEQALDMVQSAGAKLRQAREVSGVSTEDMAMLLKVPVSKLEALEADRFDLLPDTVFARALAASFCRTLKLDPGPVLALFPRTKAPSLKTDDSGINTPFRVAGSGLSLSFLRLLFKPAVLAVLLLLVGAVVVVVMPLNKMEVERVLSPEAEVVISQSPAALPELPSAVDLAASTPLSMPATPLLAASAMALPAAAVTKLPTAPASAPALVVAPATTSLLSLRAQGSSWIEVVDATKIVQVRKTLMAGELVEVSGTLPLSVVIGSADKTEVQVRGRPFNLSSSTKDNVARFEVN